jgi:hypothetical protein
LLFRNLPVNMPAFRLRQAEQVCDAISRFRDQISGFPEPLASEFRTAALHWLTLAAAQRDVSRNACEREPFPQVFRAGDPVQGQKSEAFIPRQQTIQEMAGMILASQGCPGILLYARRRMGKSTCLQNLTGFIPQNVDVAFFNLQDPVFGSLSLFIKEVRHSITECLSAEHAGNSPQNARKSRPPHSSTDKPSNARELLAGFSQFLGQVDQQLSQRNRRLLIALDEFEYLDMNIGKLDETGQPLIPESLLDLFRASIQTHRNIIWLFSGSHRIHELKHAEWPSYFISLRTVELERFSLEETSRLLTDPLAHSQLFRGDPNRPKFSPEFWGTDGLRRLHTTADGWPHLVVLLAETCVTLVNLRNAAFVTDELFEEVRKAAVISGDSVMIQLLKNESTTPGEWDYLLRFRNSDILPLPDNDAIRKSLLRRLLVTISDNQVRLRVPLMHQWIRERSELCD